MENSEPPKRTWTAWRLRHGRREFLCRVEQTSRGSASVSVTRDGRPVEQVELWGEGDVLLSRAWRAALRLHQEYRGRPGVRPAPTRSAGGHRFDSAGDVQQEAQLMAAAERVEVARRVVLRELRAEALSEGRALGAVRAFRTAWEVLDLEYHLLIGEPLSPERYRRQLAPALVRHGRLTEP